jgi:hypothetical protein
MDTEALFGKTAFDVKGQEIGAIEAVYLDSGSGRPEWAAVRTGRTETSLAPLAGASPTDAGVQLAVDAKLVRNAPHSDHPPGQVTAELTEAQEAELYLYYSVEYTSPTADEPPLVGPPGAGGAEPDEPVQGTS